MCDAYEAIRSLGHPIAPVTCTDKVSRNLIGSAAQSCREIERFFLSAARAMLNSTAHVNVNVRYI